MTYEMSHSSLREKWHENWFILHIFVRQLYLFHFERHQLKHIISDLCSFPISPSSFWCHSFNFSRDVFSFSANCKVRMPLLRHTNHLCKYKKKHHEIIFIHNLCRIRICIFCIKWSSLERSRSFPPLSLQHVQIYVSRWVSHTPVLVCQWWLLRLSRWIRWTRYICLCPITYHRNHILLPEPRIHPIQAKELTCPWWYLWRGLLWWLRWRVWKMSKYMCWKRRYPQRKRTGSKKGNHSIIVSMRVGFKHALWEY